MTIKVKISFKAYVKLIYTLTYRKPMMLVIVFVGLVMLAWIGGYYAHVLPVPKPEIYQFITLTLILVAQPTVIFLTTKRNYDSSNHLREPLEIELTKSVIKLSGQSFYTEIRLEKLFKVEERLHWFLLYQNNLSAIIIPRKAVSREDQKELRKILIGLSGVPVHLKEPGKVK